jgi:hypothetical protein
VRGQRAEGRGQRVLWALLAALLGGCGPGSDVAPIDFELVVSPALADRISGLQVAFLKPQPSDCSLVQQSCVVNQVPSDNFVGLVDDKGVSHKAVFFSLNLGTGATPTQDVKVTGIPPGKSYAVVIEALSKADPPTLVGSSCNYIAEIVVGNNPTKIAAEIVAPIAAPASFNCDPRIEK